MPMKTCGMSILLFTLGTLLLVFGVRVYRNEPAKRDVAIGMLCIGSVVFLPGIWSTYILYGAMKEWKGYSYRQVPSYEDAWF